MLCMTALLMLAMCSKRQHVPLERYTQLLQSTVQHLRAVGAAEVLIITPPPIDEPARIAFRKQVRQHGSYASLIAASVAACLASEIASKA